MKEVYKVRSWNLFAGCALWAFSAISDPGTQADEKQNQTHMQAQPFVQKNLI